jgi:Na+-driven multidrug efflux pump
MIAGRDELPSHHSHSCALFHYALFLFCVTKARQYLVVFLWCVGARGNEMSFLFEWQPNGTAAATTTTQQLTFVRLCVHILTGKTYVTGLNSFKLKYKKCFDFEKIWHLFCVDYYI